MALFANALTYTLNWEDPQHEYEAVPDVGGFAIAGINSHDFPQQFAEISAQPPGSRAGLVANFYLNNFWVPMCVGGIDDQDVADRVFDQGVNGGARTAIKILQRTVNSLSGSALTVDGGCGPLTLAAVNACDPAALLSAYRQARVAHYEAIVAANPADLQYEENWLERARA